MLLLVFRHPTCASCVAWMCCRVSNSIKHVWACPDDQSSRRGHRFLIVIMLVFVLRHPTCVSYIAWMCCRMSDSINKHVWACPDLSFDRLGLYTFLRFLRSNFSPSRPLQLCFEAACETSFARDIYLSVCPSQLTQNTEVRGDKISHVLSRSPILSQAWVHGVGIDLILQSCCSSCYVIQPVHHVLHECVVGCPILSSMYEHVPINHRGVGIDFILQSCCSWCYVIQPLIMCCMNVL